MKPIGLLAILSLVLTGAACQSDSVVALADDGSLMAARHAAVHPRPFEGRSSGISTVTLPPPGGNVFTAAGSGEMIASHMGRGTYEIDGEILGWPVVFGSPCAPIIGGAVTLTAANGDEMWGEVEEGEICSDDLVDYEVEFSTEITGGTGRFEAATGEYTTRCTGTQVAPGSFDFAMESTWSGWIAY